MWPPFAVCGGSWKDPQCHKTTDSEEWLRHFLCFRSFRKSEAEGWIRRHNLITLSHFPIYFHSFLLCWWNPISIDNKWIELCASYTYMWECMMIGQIGLRRKWVYENIFNAAIFLILNDEKSMVICRIFKQHHTVVTQNRQSMMESDGSIGDDSISPYIINEGHVACGQISPTSSIAFKEFIWECCRNFNPGEIFPSIIGFSFVCVGVATCMLFRSTQGAGKKRKRNVSPIEGL